MKYCPYCGAELVSGAASFCSECGKNLSTDNEQPERREMRKKPERSKRRHMRKESVHTTPKRQEKKDDRSQEKSNVVHSNQNQEPDEYDGYYDDVLPADLNREREGFDMELVKKIGIIAGAVLLIIVLCIVALYLL